MLVNVAQGPCAHSSVLLLSDGTSTGAHQTPLTMLSHNQTLKGYPVLYVVLHSHGNMALRDIWPLYTSSLTDFPVRYAVDGIIEKINSFIISEKLILNWFINSFIGKYLKYICQYHCEIHRISEILGDYQESLSLIFIAFTIIANKVLFRCLL